jgi:hypothetical protein
MKTFLWPEKIRPVKGSKVHCTISKEDIAYDRILSILGDYLGKDIINKLSDVKINELLNYINEYQRLPKWLK